MKKLVFFFFFFPHEELSLPTSLALEHVQAFDWYVTEIPFHMSGASQMRMIADNIQVCTIHSILILNQTLTQASLNLATPPHQRLLICTITYTYYCSYNDSFTKCCFHSALTEVVFSP